ncbi:carbohydrate esterase family 4 protein [Mycena belliarum]|uniref:chitin deacetylase n=1 Tax=Mycena belliarum TaxID=1033014 RepID=A0AAD6U4I7_9AGAR|nr:carbohydrate esterase family 4 protein [Mycena belliae]
MRTGVSAALALVLYGSAARAQDRTTEAGEAAIKDPTAECVGYTYAPVASALANFPPLTPGVFVSSLLPGDSAGKAKFQAMSAGIPNIAPKNGSAGYPPADPDCWWTVSQCVVPKLAGLKPDVAFVPEPKTLGYGFDDGPACGHNVFYDYLAANKQKATFFYIGKNVLNYPLEAQRAVADGHEICVHTYSHPPMTTLSNEAAFGELWYGIQAIKLVTGVTPTCWRPPQGDVDDRIRYIATQLGLENVLWQFDSFDWESGTNGVTPADVQANYDHLIGNATAGRFNNVGAIMLTHELNNFTMQTAIDNYKKITGAFDHVVPIAVAQNRTQPYAETNFTMPNFAQYVAGTRTGGPPSASSTTSAGSGSSNGGAGSSGSSSSSGKATQASGKGAACGLHVPGGLVATAALLASGLMLLA